jgi:hypothetical protein
LSLNYPQIRLIVKKELRPDAKNGHASRQFGIAGFLVPGVSCRGGMPVDRARTLNQDQQFPGEAGQLLGRLGELQLRSGEIRAGDEQVPLWLLAGWVGATMAYREGSIEM